MPSLTWDQDLHVKVVKIKNTYLSFLFESVHVADVGELLECLGFLVDAINNACRSAWIVYGDVIIDVFQPGLGFLGPFCHVLIRCPIASFEMTLPFLNILQTSVDHALECEFANYLLIGGVVGLRIYCFFHFFLGIDIGILLSEQIPGLL